MRIRSRRKLWLAFAVGVLATSSAGAQPQPPANAPAGQVQFQNASNLSYREMKVRADKAIQEMEAALKEVSQLELKARLASDVVLANFLKEKLTKIDVATKSAREYYKVIQQAAESEGPSSAIAAPREDEKEALLEALAPSDRKGKAAPGVLAQMASAPPVDRPVVEHAFTMITTLLEQVRVELRAARNAIGKDAISSGVRTTVTALVDPTLPPLADPNQFPTIDPPGVAPPPPGGIVLDPGEVASPDT